MSEHCRTCGRQIRRLGGEWVHRHLWVVDHEAVPCSDYVEAEEKARPE